jgi:1-acyl-sn-glycerol-3-phosphate acyltransferase
MSTWNSDTPPPEMQRIGPAGWLRVGLRGVPLALVTFGCLALLLLVRLVERPLFGMARPITPPITRFVCRVAFAIMGIGYRVRGTPMQVRGAAVANHVGWLDIFALNAPQAVYFVSKAEVAGWTGIGWLARATGTLFIARDRRQAKAQELAFRLRLLAGHHLLFFPEGTSTDGQRLLPFKSTLFEAFFTENLRDIMHIQPITLRYHAPRGADARFYGWWGDMEFGGHLLAVLAAPRQGRVEVVFHPPLKVSDFATRKEMAAACEAQVRAGLEG